METALWGGKNKQHQTQTNTLEAKTIRAKSWRDSLHLNSRTPAITAIVAGFFMLSALPGLAVVSGSEKDTLSDATAQPLEAVAPAETSSAGLIDADYNDDSSKTVQPTQEAVGGSSSSISISMSVSSSSSTNGEETDNDPEPTVTINGQTVDLPSSGRIREDIEDKYSKTRIHGYIDSDGDSSISISTDLNNSEGD